MASTHSCAHCITQSLTLLWIHLPFNPHHPMAMCSYGDAQMGDRRWFSPTVTGNDTESDDQRLHYESGPPTGHLWKYYNLWSTWNASFLLFTMFILGFLRGGNKRVNAGVGKHNCPTSTSILCPHINILLIHAFHHVRNHLWEHFIWVVLLRFGLVRVQSTNMEEAAQSAARHFGFTLEEQPCRPSLFTVNALDRPPAHHMV